MKLGFRTKLWLGYGGLIALVLAAGAIGLSVVKSGRGAVEAILHENGDSVDACQKLIASSEHLLVEALTRPEGAAAVLDASETAVCEQALRFQQSNITLEGEAERTRHLAGAWTRFERALHADATQPQPRAELLAAFNDLRGAAHTITRMNLDNMVSLHGDVTRVARATETRLLVLLIAALAFGIWFMILTGDAVLKPVRALTRLVEQVAQGNLDVPAASAGPDEIGRLAATFNGLVASLRQFRKLGWAGVSWVHRALSDTLDLLPEPVAIVDQAGNVVLANLAAQRVLGLQAEGEIDRTRQGAWLRRVLEYAATPGKDMATLAAEGVMDLAVNGKTQRFRPVLHAVRDHETRLEGLVLVLERG